MFPAADGKSILVEVDAQLVQRTLDGASTGGPWPIPEGYNLTSPARATAAGVLVETTANAFIRQLAEWQPATGAVRALGPYNDLIDAYTSPSGSSTVVARTDCDDDFPCWLLLTDTATGHVTRVDSPIPGNGFYGGGAFSPDGSQLAVFVATNTGTTNPAAKLAVVDVATGQLRLIDGSETPVGEPYGYASWSPSGGWVFFGGLSGDLHVLRRGRSEAQALRLAGSYSLVALDRSTGEPAPAS